MHTPAWCFIECSGAAAWIHEPSCVIVRLAMPIPISRGTTLGGYEVTALLWTEEFKSRVR
jgi:hypothetical protein